MRNRSGWLCLGIVVCAVLFGCDDAKKRMWSDMSSCLDDVRKTYPDADRITDGGPVQAMVEKCMQAKGAVVKLTGDVCIVESSGALTVGACKEHLQ